MIIGVTILKKKKKRGGKKKGKKSSLGLEGGRPRKGYTSEDHNNKQGKERE